MQLANVCRFGSTFYAFMVTTITNEQGDHIGRILAQWVIVYNRPVFKNCRSCPIFWLLFATALILTKNGMGYNFGQFLINSSGHPANC
jgi:hypothetical protein